MGAKRKLKRTAEKALAKKTTKELKPHLKYYRAGKLLAESNVDRIGEFCRAYFIPMFGYVMHKHYGFGFTRLAKLSDELVRMINLVAESNTADKMRAKNIFIQDGDSNVPHHYITALEMVEDLEIECRYKFERYQKKNPPKTASAEEYAKWIAGDMAGVITDDLKIVWLHTLWTTFGFGAKRLTDCANYLKQYMWQNKKDFMAKLEEMEKCHQGSEYIQFTSIRKMLDNLNVDDEMSMSLTVA